MRLDDLVKSRGFKQFMAKLYGWGAAVVILGALFKILHLPGANLMLMIGMGTETVIFFFSAFEPPHVEPDWSMVYPELAGMYHGDETFQAELEEELEEEEAEEEAEPPAAILLSEMLSNANIDQALIDKLSSGLNNLGDSALSLNSMASASAANNEFVASLTEASGSASSLSKNLNKTADVVGSEISATEHHINSLNAAAQNAELLSKTYTNASDAINRDLSATEAFNSSINEAAQSASQLALNYNQSAELLKKSSQALDFSEIDGATYNEQMQKISQNMEALNAAYELQLQNTQSQITNSQQLQEVMGAFFNQMQASVEQTKMYREQAEQLNKNVSALNNVYGNMLTAMNVKTS